MANFVSFLRSPKQGGSGKKEERNRDTRRTSESEKPGGGFSKRSGGGGGGAPMSGNASLSGPQGSSQNSNASTGGGGSVSGGPPSGGNSREGFAPRGEPSRCGRGGFRNRNLSVTKRIDGYGPPPAKSPFGQSSANESKSDSSKIDDNFSLDDKVKLKQQALSASIIGTGIRHSGPPPPRMQREGGKSRGSRNAPLSSKNKVTEEDENWESTSETSDMGEQIKDPKPVPRNGRKSQGSGGRQVSFEKHFIFI